MAALQIRIPATAENLPGVRARVETYAREVGASATTVADLKTVVSEACNNVILYAYEEPSSGGPLELELDVESDELQVTVRDFGGGIFPQPEREVPSLHMGLPIIGALSSSLRLHSRRGEGTEIEIRLPIGGFGARSTG
jgi:serine/threonine-protein kinase RsbW